MLGKENGLYGFVDAYHARGSSAVKYGADLRVWRLLRNVPVRERCGQDQACITGRVGRLTASVLSRWMCIIQAAGLAVHRASLPSRWACFQLRCTFQCTPVPEHASGLVCLLKSVSWPIPMGEMLQVFLSLFLPGLNVTCLK
jgi:hypothetical protein